MINIQDYFEEFDSSDSLPSDHEGEIIDFLGEPSREEIGKWVDKISDLPNHSSEDCLINESFMATDDACFQLAHLLISNDLI